MGTQLQIRIDPLSMDVSKTGGRSGIQSSAEPPEKVVPNSLLAEMGVPNPESSASTPTENATSALSSLQYNIRLSAGSVVVMVMDEVHRPYTNL